MSEDPDWKRLKLSLERPYKDDAGLPVPVLLDITPEGEHIYEPQKDLVAVIGENLHRIFAERGHDFFDTRVDDRKHGLVLKLTDDGTSGSWDNLERSKTMTSEELFQLRMDILPQLHIAYGEMSQARDLLSVLLVADGFSQQSSSQSLSQLPLSQFSLLQPPSQSSQQDQLDVPSVVLTSTTVPKPSQSLSVQAFNTQLVIGSKDKALRHAGTLFKSAAQAMEKSRLRSEKYWLDALKLRRSNWGLIPAPLPPGSSTGKGADKTSKDFLVSFGLEESPLVFRRRAIGRMSTADSDAPGLEFPLRQHMRLQVSLCYTERGGRQLRGRNTYSSNVELTTEQMLRAAQVEVVEQEIFSKLIREASSLPTASARVSERLIVIEAAQAIELRFELVDSDYVPQDSASISERLQASCDLIYSSLHLLLLRAHSHAKSDRLSRTTRTFSSQNPHSLLALQPIIDMLQYQMFCYRVQSEIQKIVRTLTSVGVPTRFYFNAVGESGEELISQFQPQNDLRLSGECLLRIDNRRSLRFTFSSPSTLTANLPQVTLPIMSIPQLAQLLVDEVNNCLLNRICDVGTTLCEHVHGTWFVDYLSGRTVGRWEGHVLNFGIAFNEDRSILCTVSSIERADQRPSTRLDFYSSATVPDITLLQWVQRTIDNALSTP